MTRLTREQKAERKQTRMRNKRAKELPLLEWGGEAASIEPVPSMETLLAEYEEYERQWQKQRERMARLDDSFRDRAARYRRYMRRCCSPSQMLHWQKLWETSGVCGHGAEYEADFWHHALLCARGDNEYLWDSVYPEGWENRVLRRRGFAIIDVEQQDMFSN